MIFWMNLPQLQSKRTRTQVDNFTYSMTYIQSRTNHKSRRSQVNSVRMVHHAARGHAFSTQYDAAVQDPIIAASMRTELVDLLIPQDDNRGSKVSIVRPPARAHIITNTWATKKKYDTNGNFLSNILVRIGNQHSCTLSRSGEDMRPGMTTVPQRTDFIVVPVPRNSSKVISLPQ